MKQRFPEKAKVPVIDPVSPRESLKVRWRLDPDTDPWSITWPIGLALATPWYVPVAGGAVS